MTLTTTNGDHVQVEASETDKKILAEIARQGRVATLRANGWKMDLPTGNTVTFFDPDEITERKAKAMKLAMSLMGREGADGRLTVDAEKAIDGGYIISAAFVRAWSFELALPAVGNPDTLLDLTAKDYRALSDAVADLQAEVFPNYSTDTPEALADPHSPLGAGGG